MSDQKILLQAGSSDILRIESITLQFADPKMAGLRKNRPAIFGSALRIL